MVVEKVPECWKVVCLELYLAAEMVEVKLVARCLEQVTVAHLVLGTKVAVQMEVEAVRFVRVYLLSERQ